MSRLSLLSFILLWGCTSKLQVATHSASQIGIITQLIEFQDSQERFVCYSELTQHDLLGVNCQDENGFQFFSAGLIHKKYKIEQNRIANYRIKPSKIINLLKISLFDNYSIKNVNQYNVTKYSNKTIIVNHYQSKIIISTL